jgi:hypothetical protein
MTSAALAADPVAPTTAPREAVVLTSTQMDQVKAGQVGVCVVCANIAAAIAANALATDSTAEATTGSQTIRIGTGG